MANEQPTGRGRGRIDMGGRKIGKLTVSRRTGRCVGGVMWLCVCECGQEKWISGSDLRSGRLKSCGCIRKQGLNSPARRDISGQRFGMLTALKFSRFIKSAGGSYWLFRCDCGAEKELRGAHVKNGSTISCGCRERKTHGMSQTVEYVTWGSMLQRCCNPSSGGFVGYGAKGIYVSARWRTFENFYADMGPRPSSEHSIDRIDGSGPYAWWNCRWATQETQNNNRAPCVRVNYQGRTLTISQWSRELGLNRSTLAHRWHSGKRAETGLFRPLEEAR